MRKFILLGILVVVVGVFGVCIKQRMDGQKRSQLISWVRSSMQSEIAKDPKTYFGITIGEIVLIKASSNKYTGYVEYKYGDISDKPSLEVTIDSGDSGQMMYRSEPPRALLAKKAAESVQQLFYNSGEEKQSLLENNDDLAKATLRTLSTASETYATANNGNYPSDISNLVNANPPYVNQNFCNATVEGYTYHCSCSQAGYTFQATPIQQGVTGTAIFTITTGGSANF